MGYSLGGRLALHAILQNPALWQGAIIVSADAGLKTKRERTHALQRDQEWARRFITEDWEHLLTEWDQQSVFAGRKNSAERAEKDFSRESISRMFDVFSKGRQLDLLPALNKLRQPPILFVSGEDDEKYSARGQELSAVCANAEHAIIPDAAHRVPWENPTGFVAVVQSFINRS